MNKPTINRDGDEQQTASTQDVSSGNFFQEKNNYTDLQQEQFTQKNNDLMKAQDLENDLLYDYGNSKTRALDINGKHIDVLKEVLDSKQIAEIFSILKMDPMELEGLSYDTLFSVLMNLYTVDQYSRTRKVSTFGIEIDILDQNILSKILPVLEKFDWGDKGKGYSINNDTCETIAEAVWIIAQHGDMNVARQKEIYEKYGNRLLVGDKAYLYDRICVNENRPQRYGTQGLPQGDIYILQPIEGVTTNIQEEFQTLSTTEIDALNKNRSEVGLPPIEPFMKDRFVNGYKYSEETLPVKIYTKYKDNYRKA